MPPGARPPNVHRTPLVAPVEYFGQHDCPSLARATGVVLLNLAGQTPANPQAAAEFFQRAASSGTPLLVLVSFLGTCWKAAIQGHGLAESHTAGCKSVKNSGAPEAPNIVT